jgi:hypothetical protein
MDDALRASREKVGTGFSHQAMRQQKNGGNAGLNGLVADKETPHGTCDG